MGCAVPPNRASLPHAPGWRLGTEALQAGFEALPEGGGVVLRRLGTSANLAANGALWAPYTEDDTVVMTDRPSSLTLQRKQTWNTSTTTASSRSCARQAGYVNPAAFAAELAA